MFPIICNGQLTQLNQSIKLQTFPRTLSISSTNGSTVDATGESITLIGICHVTGGTGSKTISAAGGGKIRWKTSTSITWANGSTNFRIGVQDVANTGIEDATFDVYADLVPGVESVAANTSYSTAMETGTKTITEGDIIAISFELTNRAGADIVTIALQATQGSYSTINFSPYVTADVGSGPVKAAGTAAGVLLEFDDGTIGWVSIDGWPTSVSSATASSSFNLNTAGTDEYAAIFQVPFKLSMSAAEIVVGSLATTDNFELIFYTDPLGTPVADETISYDPDFTGSVSSSGLVQARWTSAKTLLPNTWYGVAIRPTTTNSITTSFFNMTSGFEKYKAVSDFGLNIKYCGRLNQSGAFTEVQTYQMPVFAIYINKLDAGRKEHSSSY